MTMNTEETAESDVDDFRQADRGQDTLEATGGQIQSSGPRIDTILRIPVTLQVLVGSATLPVAELLKLGHGAVIPLDSRVGDPVEVMINGRSIARGEVVVIEEDNTRFGVSLTEICEPGLNDTRS
jgi:flagellar motor switch protein FliN/FliY